MAAEPFFRLRGVGVDAPGEPPRALLDGIHLTVPEGERIALVGRSGAGKTTLLRLLNRMADPSRGSLEVCGRPMESYPPADLRRLVGWVAQSPAWLPGTCRGNLLAAQELGLITAAEAATRLPAVCRLAAIDEAWLDRTEDALSVGQKQRIMLGRALMTNPRALLLDEPTSALDPPGGAALLRQVVALGKAEGLTLVLVTHRLEDAGLLAHRTVVLEAGRLVDEGPTEEVIPRLEADWEQPLDG